MGVRSLVPEVRGPDREIRHLTVHRSAAAFGRQALRNVKKEKRQQQQQEEEAWWTAAHWQSVLPDGQKTADRPPESRRWRCVGATQPWQPQLQLQLQPTDSYMVQTDRQTDSFGQPFGNGSRGRSGGTQPCLEAAGPGGRRPVSSARVSGGGQRDLVGSWITAGSRGGGLMEGYWRAGA